MHAINFIEPEDDSHNVVANKRPTLIIQDKQTFKNSNCFRWRFSLHNNIPPNTAYQQHKQKKEQ